MEPRAPQPANFAPRAAATIDQEFSQTTQEISRRAAANIRQEFSQPPPPGLISSPNVGLSPLNRPSFRFPTTTTNAQRRQAAHDLLQSAVIMIRQGYGPTPFRNEQGWTLEEAEGAAKASINALDHVTDRAVQDIFKSFIDSMRDGHTDFTVADRRSHGLPFDAVSTSDGQIAVGWVDGSKLPSGVVVRPGDVITSFNGRPIANVIADLARRERQTNPDAALIAALQTLTTRQGSSLHEVPDIDAEAVIGLRGEDGQERTASLRWLASSAIAESPFDGGAATGYPRVLGPLAEPARDSDPFASYVYNLDGRRVGYVRITTFSPTDEKGNEDTPATDARFVRQFQDRIRALADTTDALVVDLRDSLGGSTTIENLLSASLSPVPLRSPVDALRNTARLKQETQTRIAALDKGVGDDNLTNLFSNPDEVRRNERAYLVELLRQLDEGRPWSTPMPLDGMAEIPPAPSPYRRPVIFLTNPGTASSSENMPAKFQDNRDRRQATVAGGRTAGWGGTVESVTISNRFGITSMSYTESLSIRMDGTPLPEDIPAERLIESRGVIPDDPIAVTLNDLRNDFADYRRSVNAVVMREILTYESKHGRRAQRSQ